MRSFQVVSAYASINQGRVLVSQDQFRARAHALVAIGEPDEHGCIEAEVTGSIGFKKGELFAYDGELSKALVLCLDEVEIKESYDPGNLEDMEREELLQMALALDLKPHPNTGKAKLIEAIKARQDEMLKEQDSQKGEGSEGNE